MPASLPSSTSISLSRGFRACLFLLATAGLAATASGQTPYAYLNQWVPLAATGFNQPIGVAVDPHGNIFVADSANHAVKEILAEGGYSTVNTLASGFTFNTPADVALDKNGNVFVADNGANAVYKITKAGGYVTVKAIGSGFVAPTSVAVDSSGNVFVADSGNNAVKEIEAPTDRTVVTLGGGYSFGEVYGVALDASGNLFVADIESNAVDELTAGSSYASVTPLGDGFAFQDPSAVAVDADGNLYVNQIDFPNNLLEIPAAGGYATVLELSYPTSEAPLGLAADANGDLFVGDVNNNQVDEVEASTLNLGTFNVGSTSPVTTLTFIFSSGGTIDAPQVLTQGNASDDFTDAGTGTCDTNGTSYTYNSGDTCTVDIQFKPTHPGPRWGAVELTSGGLFVGENYVMGMGEGPQSFFQFPNNIPFPLPPTGFSPSGLAVDANENVFVMDASSGSLLEITAASGYTTVNQVVPNSSFSSYLPYASALAMDAAGNFVVGVENYLLQFDHNGNYLGYVNEVTVPGGSFSFPEPLGMAVDKNGNLFVADPELGAVVELYWWDYYYAGVVIGSDWGQGVALDQPTGVALDASGNLFVADPDADEVFELPVSNGYTTETALGSSGFNGPFALALDPNGNLYVTELSDAVVELPAAGGYTTENLASVGAYPAIAIDASGNIFLGDSGYGSVDAIDVASPPALSFATTAVGSTSTSSPLTVTVGNNGNQPLTVSAVRYPRDFPENSGVATDCTSGQKLQPGDSCTVSIDFSPLIASVAGPTEALQEAVTVISNTLNSSPSAKQSVAVSGTATSTYPFGGINSAKDQITKWTTPEQGDPIVITGWAADPVGGAPVNQVTVEIDGSPVGVATLGIANTSVATEYGSADLDSGWTFTYPAPGLAAGTHTIGAMVTSVGGTVQLAPHTITVTSAPAPPFGALGAVEDAITKTTPVGQSDGLLVTGWAADLVDHAPVSGGVSIFIDCTTNIDDCVAAGPATLGIPDPAVVTSTGDAQLLNSGWSFTENSLTTGTHTIAAVAYDSGGRSTILGTRTVTVQANAPPFGATTSVVDSVTRSTVVSPTDSALVTGWAADVHDGAPVITVAIYIDCDPATSVCVPVGYATLGIKKTAIASEYGSRYLKSGWSYTVGVLAAGNHTAIAVATDSLGQSTEFPGRTFTVSTH